MPPSQLTVPDDLVFTSDGQNMLALKGTATPPAAVVHAPPSAVADGDLSASSIAPSIDETAHALRIHAEYADGSTIKTAVIPFDPPSSITVGPSGADFTTIQAAWDSLKGRPLSSLVTIDVQAGTYAQTVNMNQQPYSSLIRVQGDTRTAAGQHFATTGTITRSGSDCTITLVNTPPSDFTNADYIVIGGAASAANVGRFPIVSINTGAKTATYTNAAGIGEAVRVNTRLIFCPDRMLDFTGLGNGVTSGCSAPPTFSGFTLVSTSTGISAIAVVNASALIATRCLVYADSPATSGTAGPTLGLINWS